MAHPDAAHARHADDRASAMEADARDGFSRAAAGLRPMAWRDAARLALAVFAK